MHTRKIDRSPFWRTSTAVAAALLSAGPGSYQLQQAHAGDAASRIGVDLGVGVVLPADHPALAGVRLGGSEAEHAARLFGTTFELHETAAAGAAAVRAAAEHMVAQQGTAVLIGGANATDADALAAVARSRGLVFLNIGAAADSLSRRCDPLTFHVQPSAAVRDAALRLAPDAPPSARAVLWHATLTRFGAGQVNDRYVDAAGQPMSEHAWAGWLAVKIAFDAAQRAGTTDGAALAAHLAGSRTVFDGHKGVQLSFRTGTHELRQPLYIVVDDDLIAEVPASRDAAGRSPAELLDTLMPAGESCT